MLETVFILFLLCFYIGISAENSEVKLYSIGNGTPKILVISGVHGDEIAGVVLVKELLFSSLKNGTLYLIPEANFRAVDLKKRTPYYMDDLNRSFPGSDKNLTQRIAREIYDIIDEIQPNLIIDLHESPYKYDENKDPNLYIGNTVILAESTLEKFMDLVLEFELITILGGAKGSLNYEVSSRLKIPVLTIETSKEEDLYNRVEKQRDIVKRTLEYFRMELE
ncbi:succinylglutamate desuccinylase/aspartoacylase family protein [Cetobacterium sp. 2A]|uniref:M99 family carboxypeptidase catalytic domain-containing protein n=1 Tax=Cetobacterium sp. 2A TaxID=2754723 RepID=UPI00163C4A8F|nr:succinylglutamate desuccinylase/aspartoacylase family protein [Cetobacterium sp. 2A]MBC2855029.1 succinylglutamate desuccinylase/aspartoacylase family protein [Cetobacterium sp. 2A]